MKNKLSVFIIVFFTTMNVFSQSGASISGKINTASGKEKHKVNTIVYIDKADGNFKVPAKNPSMDQKNLTFIPRVLPVLVGSTVDFLNADDVLHNVFSPDACAGKFNLGSWPKGQIKKHKYDKVGCQSVVLCNVHPEMEAYVVVLQNPYYTVADKEGNYTIKNVPAGKYTLQIWNEKFKSAAIEITVPASGKVEANFDLKK